MGGHLDPLLALFTLLHLATLLSVWKGHGQRALPGPSVIPWIVCISGVIDTPSLVPLFL